MDDIELRWFARDLIHHHSGEPQVVLQYRKRRHLVNYSAILPTGEYTNEPVWMEWVDVPTHTQ
jgi:hypothetical protein